MGVPLYTFFRGMQFYVNLNHFELFKHFLFVFDQIDEEHQTQIELEISLITTWRDTQVD